MNAIYLTGKEPLIAEIARAAFPGYSGKKFKLETQTTVNCRSYWDGGSRDYYVFVKLATMTPSAQVPAQSMFDKQIAGIDSVPLPDGIACVRHAIFCGVDMGLTIIVNPTTMNPAMLPAKVELTLDERIVLAATSGLKASYQGVQIRPLRAREETGITQARYDDAKQTLIARGLLTKAGAITSTGRNAIGDTRLSTIRQELRASTPKEVV